MVRLLIERSRTWGPAAASGMSECVGACQPLHDTLLILRTTSTHVSSLIYLVRGRCCRQDVCRGCSRRTARSGMGWFEWARRQRCTCTPFISISRSARIAHISPRATHSCRTSHRNPGLPDVQWPRRCRWGSSCGRRRGRLAEAMGSACPAAQRRCRCCGTSSTHSPAMRRLSRRLQRCAWLSYSHRSGGR